MWSGIGKFVASLVTGLVSSIASWWSNKKLKREASRGRAAKEFLESEDKAKAEEEKQKDAQDAVTEDDVVIDPDDIFGRD